jgi:hypothetical protein
MSHAEIWDDSALVDSWNEALKEYKARSPPSRAKSELIGKQQYHSISARGEQVEDVLRNSENQRNGMSVKRSPEKSES